METKFLLNRLGLGWNGIAKLSLSGLALFGATQPAKAAVISANAQLSGVLLGHGQYAYTLTLQNTPASTSNIGLFWFAWAAGQADFLQSQPTSIQTPANWSAVVEGGGGDDGYSIQFVTFTQPLTPGSSVTFTFKSPDSPSIMGGPAVFYHEYQTLTSQAYSNHAASGVQELFLAQLVVTDLGNINFQAQGPNLLLDWTSGTNVVLQQTSDFALANWSTVPGTLGKSSFTATNASLQTNIFYRLATE